MKKKAQPKQSHKQLRKGVSKLAINRLAEHAKVIRDLSKRTTKNIVEIGRHLTESKKLVRHGNWAGWLEMEFAWSEATALNFMRVYELAESINFTDMKFEDLNIAPSALYALARPDTPKEVRNEMVDRAAAGEPVSHKTVQAVLTARKSGNGSTPTDAITTPTDAITTDAVEAPSPPAAGEAITATEAPPPPPATESDDDTGPKSEGQEGEPQLDSRAQAQDQDPLRDLEPQLRWKVIEARHWFNKVTEVALQALKCGQPAEQFLDPVLLQRAIREPEKVMATWADGAAGLSTLVDKVKRALAPPAAPMFETPDSATPDQA